MGICPFLNGNECLREKCQLFIQHKENGRCALWWMGMEAMAEFEEDRGETLSPAEGSVASQLQAGRRRKGLRQWGA